jgi:cell division protease FtsH
MINSICKILMIVVCGSLFSISHTEEQTKEVVPSSEEQTSQLPTELQRQEVSRAIAKELDTMYQQTLDLYQKLDSLFEELALMIQNNLIKADNKSELIGQIRGFRQLTDQIRRDVPLTVGAQHIYILLSLYQALLEHVEMAVKQGLHQLPAFDLQAFITRRTASPVDLSLELLQEHIGTSSEQFKALREDSTKIGLTWYNKAFRRLADFNYKYHLLTLGGKTALTASMWGLFLAFHFDVPEEIIERDSSGKEIARKPNPEYAKISSLRKKLQWLLGSPSRSTTIETGRGGLIGWLNNFGLLVGLGQAPALSVLATATWHLWAPEWVYVKEAYAKISARISGILQGGIEKVQIEQIQKITPAITFDDVVGLDYVKDALMDIVRYIEDPERYDLVKITPEKGFLLSGPSRTGKSWCAEALCGEIQKVLERNGRNKDDFGFYEIKAQLILEKGISYLNHIAQSSAPCVLFIDEIDLLGLQRAGGNLELLSQFLQSMSGYLNNNGRKQVIFLAATNKQENIDEALRKRGRFGKIINFTYPPYAERKAFLKKKLEALAIDLGNFNLDLIVQQTEGRTFEDLNAMLKTALKKAKVLGMPLTQEHLNDALSEELHKIILKMKRDITPQEIDILSCQIAGRALTHMLLNCTRGLSCATIEPIAVHIAEQTVFERLNKKEKDADSTITQKAIEYGSIFTGSNKHDSINLNSHEDYIKECKVLIAGNIAEKLLLGSCGFSYRPEDRQKAFEIIKKLIFAGLKVEDLSKKSRDQHLEECHALLKQCEDEVTALLTQHRAVLDRIAENLRKHSSLTATQIKTLIDEVQPA